MLDKLLQWIQEEATKHAVADIRNPGKGRKFQFGVAHGKQQAFSLVEQRIQELLEEEEDDDTE